MLFNWPKADHSAREKNKKEKTELEAHKARVRARTQQAIKTGELVPQPCRFCGDPNVQAHHLTYDGPLAHLNVDWLCNPHHAIEHGRRGWTRQKELFPEIRTAIVQTDVSTVEEIS
jgi:hypothetical protein